MMFPFPGKGGISWSRSLVSVTWPPLSWHKTIHDTLIHPQDSSWKPYFDFQILPSSPPKNSRSWLFLGGRGGEGKGKEKHVAPNFPGWLDPPVSSSIFWFQSCSWKGDSWHVRLHNMCCITCPSLKQTTSSYSCRFLCWDYLQISNVPHKDLFVVDIFSWTWSFFTSFTLKN